MTWLEEVKGHSLVTMAQALGLKVAGRGIAPCAACGALRRGSADPRRPVGMTSDYRGWSCHRCGQKGDGITLAALALLGTNMPKGEQWGALREALASKGLCGSAAMSTITIARPQASPEAPHVAKRPPRGEVEALWQGSVAVMDDQKAAEWLQSRGLDPATIDDRGLSRAVPRDYPLPSWAQFRGQQWTATNHRLLVPLIGPTGEMESIHARALVPCEAKAVFPKGAEVRGLVMADGLGRQLLTGRRSGQGWPDPIRVLIAEGVPDFLTWATWFGDAADDAPAVLAVVSGSWTAAIAARIPAASQVYVRTHDDPAGAKYAKQIVATLGRCTVFARNP